MFSVVVSLLTRSDADINRVSKELPTGEALSTRMLVFSVCCQLEMQFFIKYGLVIRDICGCRYMSNCARH